MDVGRLDAARADAREARLPALPASPRRWRPLHRRWPSRHSLAAGALARRNLAAAHVAAAAAGEVPGRASGKQQGKAIAACTTPSLATMLQGRLDEAAVELDAVLPRAAALPPGSLQVARVALARSNLTRPRAERADASRRCGTCAPARPRRIGRALVRVTAQRMRGRAQLGLVQLEQGAPAGAAVSLWRAVQAFEQQETVAMPAQDQAQLAIQRRALSAPRRATERHHAVLGGSGAGLAGSRARLRLNGVSGAERAPRLIHPETVSHHEIETAPRAGHGQHCPVLPYARCLRRRQRPRPRPRPRAAGGSVIGPGGAAVLVPAGALATAVPV